MPSYDWEYCNGSFRETELEPDQPPGDIEQDTVVYVGPYPGNEETYGPIPARLVNWSRVRIYRRARVEHLYS
jgi:hypothetical protein